MFAFTTRVRENQSRQSLKKNLSTMISGALKRNSRQQDRADEITLGGSSELDSECSTLINFDIHESQYVALPIENSLPSDDDSLDIEDQAWTNSRNACTAQTVSHTRASFRPPQKSYKPSLEATMLDEDDCTWVKPRKPVTSKIQKSFAGRKETRKARVAPVLHQRELLEPEERSWM